MCPHRLEHSVSDPLAVFRGVEVLKIEARFEDVVLRGEQRLMQGEGTM